MKKTTVRLFVMQSLSLAALSLLAWVWGDGSLHAQEPVEKPDFEFSHQTHDFGQVKDKQSHTFTFTNTGNAPLLLKYVATGCGCTTTEYTKDPVQPGKTGKVVVTFDPATQRKGAFRKSVTIYTNAPKDYTRLFIKGEVTRDSMETEPNFNNIKEQ